MEQEKKIYTDEEKIVMFRNFAKTLNESLRLFDSEHYSTHVLFIKCLEFLLNVKGISEWLPKSYSKKLQKMISQISFSSEFESEEDFHFHLKSLISHVFVPIENSKYTKGVKIEMEKDVLEICNQYLKKIDWKINIYKGSLVLSRFNFVEEKEKRFTESLFLFFQEYFVSQCRSAFDKETFTYYFDSDFNETNEEHIVILTREDIEKNSISDIVESFVKMVKNIHFKVELKGILEIVSGSRWLNIDYLFEGVIQFPSSIENFITSLNVGFEKNFNHQSVMDFATAKRKGSFFFEK